MTPEQKKVCNQVYVSGSGIVCTVSDRNKELSYFFITNDEEHASRMGTNTPKSLCDVLSGSRWTEVCSLSDLIEAYVKKTQEKKDA